MQQEPITKPYADYKYYTDTYHGTSYTDENEFLKDCYFCSVYLDGMTFGRIPRLTILPEEVRMAVCRMCDTYKSYGAINGTESGSRNLRSENLDGYSVSYQNATESEKNSELKKVARTYLANSRLLYKGVCELDY